MRGCDYWVRGCRGRQTEEKGEGRLGKEDKWPQEEVELRARGDGDRRRARASGNDGRDEGGGMGLNVPSRIRLSGSRRSA